MPELERADQRRTGTHRHKRRITIRGTTLYRDHSASEIAAALRKTSELGRIEAKLDASERPS
jgi:hypothetical protein